MSHQPVAHRMTRIIANAGSGKTYALSTRYIAIMAAIILCVFGYGNQENHGYTSVARRSLATQLPKWVWQVRRTTATH